MYRHYMLTPNTVQCSIIGTLINYWWHYNMPTCIQILKFCFSNSTSKNLSKGIDLKYGKICEHGDVPYNIFNNEKLETI